MITDPPPISFTTLSKKEKKKNDMQRVTCDTFGEGEHSLKISAP